MVNRIENLPLRCDQILIPLIYINFLFFFMIVSLASYTDSPMHWAVASSPNLLGQTGVPKKTHKPHITWQIMKHSGDRFLQINLTAYSFFGVSCFSCICSVARSQKFYTSVQMKAVMWTVKCLWGRRGSLLDPLVCFTPEAALQYWILNWVQIWKAMVFGCEHVLFIM